MELIEDLVRRHHRLVTSLPLLTDKKVTALVLVGSAQQASVAVVLVPEFN